MYLFNSFIHTDTEKHFTQGLKSTMFRTSTSLVLSAPKIVGFTNTVFRPGLSDIRYTDLFKPDSANIPLIIQIDYMGCNAAI